MSSAARDGKYSWGESMVGWWVLGCVLWWDRVVRSFWSSAVADSKD